MEEAFILVGNPTNPTICFSLPCTCNWTALQSYLYSNHHKS